jgi:dolichol-phosphate mannosyltransferase
MSVRDQLVGAAETAVPTAKLRRLVGYGGVGATGVVVDLGVLEALTLAGTHHLVALLIAYGLAMTWNFGLQRALVYRATGNPWRQWCRYAAVDAAAFALRVAVVVATVDLASPWAALPYVPAPVHAAVPASAVGIALAFLVGFQGAETVVFGREVRDGGR